MEFMIAILAVSVMVFGPIWAALLWHDSRMKRMEYWLKSMEERKMDKDDLDGEEHEPYEPRPRKNTITGDHRF